MHDNCARAIRMRDDRHDRHASGERKGQRENQSYLFHGHVPFSPAQCTLPEPARNSVIGITFWSFLGFRLCQASEGKLLHKQKAYRNKKLS